MFKSQIGGLALNRRKWPEMGPEWSPGPENRPPGMPRPFSRLWDRSRGPKPPKYMPNSRSTAPSGHYWYMQSATIGHVCRERSLNNFTYTQIPCIKEHVSTVHMGDLCPGPRCRLIDSFTFFIPNSWQWDLYWGDDQGATGMKDWSCCFQVPNHIQLP